MSAHRRMRAYMDKHKVGALFEDLMSKLVSEMPSEPVPFLIRVLQQKLCQVVPQSVMTIPRLRRSLGDLALTVDVEKAPVHKKPSSALLRRSRPSTPSISVPHPLPRKTVTLKCPKEKRMDADKSEIKSPWPESCNPALVSPQSEKNVFEVSQGVGASLYVKSNSEPPPSNNKLYQTCGYNGPILPGQVFDEDPLDDELIDFGPKTTINTMIKLNNFEHSRKKSTTGINMYPRNKHVSSKSSMMTYTRNDNFTNKRMDFLRTIEMFEDPEDLLNEGIYIRQGTGFKVNNREFYKNEHNGRRESLHFNICSVCTKMSKYQDYFEDDVPGSDDNFKITSPVSEKNVQRHTFQIRNCSTNESVTSKPANKVLTVMPSVTNVFRANTKSPNSVLDTERTTSTEDLFATPRSLPLPLTPVDKITLEWCTPSLEAIHACANGWDVITSQDSDIF